MSNSSIETSAIKLSILNVSSVVLKTGVWVRWCTACRALFGTTLHHCHAHRALARLQFNQAPPPLLRPFIMPASLSFFTRGALRIVRLGGVLATRIAAACLRNFAGPILVGIGNEALTRVRLFAEDRADRFVLSFPVFVLLTPSSAYARLGQFCREFCTALSRGDIPRSKYLAGCIAQVAGEIFVLRFGVRLLDIAVSFFFLLLEH
jgi:hypothetical protein